MTLNCHTKHDLILWDVVEEHFDEADFLFGQWEGALHAPKFNWKNLGTIELRLEAHLDALVVGGSEVAARILDPELTNADEVTRATIAALALLSNTDEEDAGRLIDQALQAQGPLQQALTRALVLVNLDMLDRMLVAGFQAAMTDAYKALLLEVLTARGVDVGEDLYLCSKSSDQSLIDAVIQAAGRFGRKEMIFLAEDRLRSGHPLSNAALRGALALGSSQAWRLCRQLAEDPQGDDPQPLLLTALLGDCTDHQILYAQLDNPRRVEQALWALGFCGTIEAAAECLNRLESGNEREAKLAAEAIAWIGGFDLYDPKFGSPAADPAEDETLPAFDQDDMDATPGEDSVDNLPVPNPAAIALWWQEHSGIVTPGQRYMLGLPFSLPTMIGALERGSLWRRHGVAWLLNIRSGGQRHVSTDAFSWRQHRQIANLSGMNVTGFRG